jgi:hypothetical protein
MTKSRISKSVLVSAAALASSLLHPSTSAFAQESASAGTTEGLGLGDRALDFDQYREAINELREQVAENPELEARYLANPRAVLSEAGLPVNLQYELMRQDNLVYGPGVALDCSCSICTQTCLKTN